MKFASASKKYTDKSNFLLHFLHIYIHIWIWIFAFVCKYMYIHTQTHTNKEIELSKKRGGGIKAS